MRHFLPLLLAAAWLPAAEAAPVDALAQAQRDLAASKQTVHAYALTISKQDVEIKALREQNQVLSNALELARQAVNEARQQEAKGGAKPPF